MNTDKPADPSIGSDLVPVRPGALLPIQDARLTGFFSEVCHLLMPPASEPKAHEVLDSVTLCLQTVSAFLPEPTARFVELLALAEQTTQHLSAILGHSHASAPLSLKGHRSKHPAWVGFAEITAGAPSNTVARLLAGSTFLCAAHARQVQAQGDRRGRKVSGAVTAADAAHIRRAGTHADLTDEQIRTLLIGSIDDGLRSSEWAIRLQRTWREVIIHYSKSEPPPPTPHEMFRGQVLSSALNSSARHAAGAQTHRELTQRQLELVVSAIKTAIKNDEYEGAVGFLVMRTGFTLELLSELPLAGDADNQSVINETAYLDTSRGVVCLDTSIVAHQASRGLPGSIDSGYVLTIRLPQNLARQLLQRHLASPSARSLNDLYPKAPALKGSDPVYPTTDEIVPSWSRLRYSLGLHLRTQGMNSFLAAMLCGDFGSFPRSKFHYITVPADELCRHEDQLYLDLGLEPAVAARPDMPGFGCRVTPEKLTLIVHDLSLRERVQASRPGKRSTLASLIDFHNHYTNLCGWRLSILLALRETTHIDLSAASDFSDQWVEIHDKSTIGDREYQPVPLCDFSREVIRLYKAHCAAMSRRLRKLGLASAAVDLCCKSVSDGKTQRLLFRIVGDQVMALASKHFLPSEIPSRQVAPDVGRKAIENLLREQDVPSTSIDYVLRHFKTGQDRSNAFHPSSLMTFVRTVSPALDRIALELFQTQVSGLANE